MANSLLLKGVKDIVNYTSTDGNFPIRLKQNPRGGDVHQIKQWWAKKGNNTVYNACTVFEIVGTKYWIVIPTCTSTQLGIGYNGDVYSMTFSNYNQVDRIAIMADGQLQLEYLLPSVSGGTIAKRIVMAAPDIGVVTINGTRNATTAVTNTYTANYDGSASDVTYVWTTTDSGATITNGTSATCTIAYDAASAPTYSTNVELSSATASTSPVNKAIVVTVTDPITIGTVSVSGVSSPTVGVGANYTASITGNAADLTYDWTASGSATLTNETSATCTVNFGTPGNHDVHCAVSSVTADDTETGSMEVDAVTIPTIGTVTIAGAGAPVINTENAYTANYDGDSLEADISYAWTCTPTNTSTITGATDKSPNINFSAEDSYAIQVVVTNSKASPTSVTTTRNVTSVDS